MSRAPNIDPGEVGRFDALAHHWWDTQGEFRSLHEINPLRLQYIEERAPLAGRSVVDVGCGGGILAEALARRGARVTGIDMAEASLSVARLHLLESDLQVDYRCTTAEQLAQESPGTFDLVTCMELLEHVPDPGSLVRACARLARPGGQVFFSTLNRNPKAYLFAIVAAEYVLRLLPRGTHDYARFVRPSELESWMRSAGLRLVDLTGLSYNPMIKRYFLTKDISVNYLAHGVRGEADLG